MPETLTDIETTGLELACGAFDTFCEDIAGMFGIGASGESIESCSVTLKKLKKDFKKINAIFSVESKGAINGNFYVILNQDALFTLAGTFVMLPEKVITQNRIMGKEKEAEEIEDAVGEVGNLLIGAWDRYFREELEGHKHFLQTGTSIIKSLPGEEFFGFGDDVEVAAEMYEMTIEPFDPVKCCVLFPKTLFSPAEETTSEPETQPEPEDSKEEPAPQAADPENTPHEDDEVKVRHEPVISAETPGQQIKPEDNTETEDNTEAKTIDTEVTPEPEAEIPQPKTEPSEEPENSGEIPPAEDTTAEPAAEQPAETVDASEPVPVTETADNSPEETADETPSEDRPVSRVIKTMTSSSATLPGEMSIDILNSITAKDVMRTDIAWASQDDTVENTLAKMQNQNIGYVIVGSVDSIEGIVSKSDIKGALSPYLQSIFSKWKRELDTATLQIKIRWIMSRPVHTVRPDATLAAVMEMMSKHSIRALPIADEQGLRGIVTAYTIFNALANSANHDTETKGENTDIPALAD